MAPSWSSTGAVPDMGQPPGRIENRIRRLRFDAGEMTQKDLADRVGVTRQAMKYRIDKWGVTEALSRPIRTSSGRRRSTWSAK